MSLILEALRKSEAERRRGRTPDLHAELPPIPTRPRRVPSWFWIGWVLALVLVTAVLWPRGEDAPSADGRATRSDVAATPGTGENLARRADEAPAPAPFPRVDRIAAPTGRAQTAPPDTSAATAADAETAAAQRKRTAGAETAAASMPQTDAADAPPTPDAPAAEPVPAAGPAPALPAAPAGAILKLSELSPETRRQLPPMKLSMHMWNERPAQRFVILDGQRYAEGDRIGDAVVTTIDTDGVVLDLDGRAVRVPLP